MCLKVPDTSSLAFKRREEGLMLQDERHNEVYDDRRADGKKRKVNKVHADACGIDT
jgi:hypothetical protein